MLQALALKSGIAGAVALNAIHETARKTLPNAPHVDEIAMRAVDRLLRPVGVKLNRKELRRVAFVGDLISNSIYYSAIGGIRGSVDPRKIWVRGIVFGAVAGVGAVVLPPFLGLGQQKSRNFNMTASLTIAWYLIGALVASGVISWSQLRRLRALTPRDFQMTATA